VGGGLGVVWGVFVFVFVGDVGGGGAEVVGGGGGFPLYSL